MGTKFGDIIEAREISIGDLSRKRLVFDAYNLLYQFLSTIRQRDGTPLKDFKGNVTSHLSGLFFRTAKLMKEDIKVAFVFDGQSPDLKNKEKERRRKKKEEAQEKYEKAVEEQDLELMRKYATRTSRLTSKMVDEAKELIDALGLPHIQAPSEGEAQAAYMVKKGEFDALVSRDYDGLMFASPLIVRNLSVTGRRRKPGTQSYYTVEPESIDLSENLNLLGIDIDQLRIVGILCGTDFNIGGVKGIGPKTALKLVKKHGKNFEALFDEVDWDFETSWKDILNLFKEMPVIDDYGLEWGRPDEKKIREILIERHDFSDKRVNSVLEDIEKNQAQTGLGDFF